MISTSRSIQLSTEPEIRVGLYTDGAPRISAGEGCHVLENLLIGHGFHWQQTIKATLPGRIEPFRDNDDETITLVNILPVEDYLRCVAVSEMSPEAPAEFLKAHAIIARSWVMRRLLRKEDNGKAGAEDTPTRLIGWDDTSSHIGFDVCSDDHCQRYQGNQPLSKEVCEALESTRGIVLTDSNGEIADTRYSKCCGGATELFSTCWQEQDLPYLRSFADPYCKLSSFPTSELPLLLNRVLKGYDRNPVPFGQWEKQITKAEIADNLRRKFGRDLGDIKTVEVIERGPSCRARLLRLEGTSGSLEIGKELYIRRLLAPTHLYSSMITLTDEGDAIRITGQGWGHGVGLCQIGAARMAAGGASCREILAFYYPSTSFTRLYE